MADHAPIRGSKPKVHELHYYFLTLQNHKFSGSREPEFPNSQSACPILTQKADVLRSLSTLVVWAWSQPDTQPGLAEACLGHAAASGQALESKASPHKSSCCKEGRLPENLELC